MEKVQEIKKLVNVLRKTARLAQQASWSEEEHEGDSARYSIEQYNRVLSRLSQLDASVTAVFQPLAMDTSLNVTAMACRQLSAYFEDELRPGSGWAGIYDAAVDTDSFKDFWRQSAKDIEDLGDYIREHLESWARDKWKGADTDTREKEE